MLERDIHLEAQPYVVPVVPLSLSPVPWCVEERSKKKKGRSSRVEEAKLVTLKEETRKAGSPKERMSSSMTSSPLRPRDLNTLDTPVDEKNILKNRLRALKPRNSSLVPRDKASLAIDVDDDEDDEDFV